MPTDITPPAVTIITLPFRQGNELIESPCVLVDGKVSGLMTQWLAVQALHGSSPSTLEQYAYGLRRFTEYYLTKGGVSTPEELVYGFSRALDQGDKALHWEPLEGKTASRYFDTFCMFFDWVTTLPEFKNYAHPNPLVDREMTPHERVVDQARNRQSDMLHHLYPLTKRGQGIRTMRKYPQSNRWSRSSSGPALPIDQPGAGWAPAGMHLHDYVRLIKEEPEPRNRLLFLALGAGAARISEALQIFASDVYYDHSTHEAIVALANPVKGMVLLPSNRTVERRQFLADKYGTRPRCLLPRNHPLHVGWKGIFEGGFDDQERPVLADWRNRRWSLMEWMMPVFGRMFWSAHVEYMKTRAAMRPKHPFYFVNLEKNKGAPLTRSAAKQLLSAACTRLGIQRHSPHKLRHMYGNYLAEIGMSLADAQIMMRHRNPASTLVYFRVKRSVARERLTLAERQTLLAERERTALLFPIT